KARKPTRKKASTAGPGLPSTKPRPTDANTRAIMMAVSARESITSAANRLPRPAVSSRNETRSGVATTSSSPSPERAGAPSSSTNADHMSVRAPEFVTRRQTEWERLEELLRRARRIGGLRPAEALELAALYRRATADLARAQRDWPDQPVTDYLNGLVARGHARVYREGGAILPRLARFYAQTVPRTYRESGAFLLASAILLFGPAIVAFTALLADPQLADHIVPPQLVDVVKHHRLWTEIPPDARPYASGLIITNNVIVSILVFVLGIVFALPTVGVLVINGVTLGALFGLTTAYGVSGGLLEFVISHGPLELSVVIAAGASGLMLGWALLQPGAYSRRDALTMAGRRAYLLLVGLAPLLVRAGAIEGHLRPPGAPFAAQAPPGVGAAGPLYRP